MGLDPRVVGAPALATCVHVSLVFAKQALLPALLGDAYSPAALARLLGLARLVLPVLVAFPRLLVRAVLLLLASCADRCASQLRSGTAV